MFGGGSNTLTFTLLGRDRVSPAMDSAGKSTDKTKAKFTAFKGVAAAAGIAAGAALLKFGIDSVKAASEAEESQKKLAFAFAQFPRLSDTSQAALQKLNSELAKKTKFDDDNIASGQAVLAQFRLTGTQIRDVTPLVLDYASRMGIDVPTASQNVGKALLGNAKALKNIGITYKSTGNATQDYANITKLMREKVGGFAETEGKTAAGQAAILRNQFGELQETVGQKLIPVLTGLATVGLKVVGFISKNSAVIMPLLAAIGAVIIAVKAYTIVQRILNLTLWANPIGIVIIALVALGVGLVVLYKKSETFRKIVQGAFGGVSAAAGFMWHNVLQPTFSWLGTTFVKAQGWASTFGRTVSSVWVGIKTAFQTGVRVVVGVFLDMVQKVLDGAASAFGWVPKLGDKLRSAATNFGKFRDGVNKSLGGITDQQVNITMKYTNTGVNLTAPSSVGRRWAGGPIRGRGTGTSDTAGIYALSNNEHVVTADEVKAAGGHGAVYRIRQAMKAGLLRGLARGGPAQFGLNTAGLNAGALGGNAVQAVRLLVGSAAKTLASAGSLMSKGLVATLSWARTQVGKPYVWGGVGPGGYDCSGWVSALVNKALGQNPYHRRGATGSMPWSNFAPGRGAFMVGWFKGNPGHTAATINGVNLESRGGRGVVMGSGARGASNGLFTNRMRVKGFRAGGAVQGDPAFDLVSPRGKSFVGRDVLAALLGRGRQVLMARNGGVLWPGMFAYNETSRPERVFNHEQLAGQGIDYRKLADILIRAAREARPIDNHQNFPVAADPAAAAAAAADRLVAALGG